MRICTECGSQIADDAIFCSYCGTRLKNRDNEVNHTEAKQSDEGASYIEHQEDETEKNIGGEEEKASYIGQSAGEESSYISQNVDDGPSYISQNVDDGPSYIGQSSGIGFGGLSGDDAARGLDPYEGYSLGGGILGGRASSDGLPGYSDGLPTAGYGNNFYENGENAAEETVKPAEYIDDADNAAATFDADEIEYVENESEEIVNEYAETVAETVENTTDYAENAVAEAESSAEAFVENAVTEAEGSAEAFVENAVAEAEGSAEVFVENAVTEAEGSAEAFVENAVAEAEGSAEAAEAAAQTFSAFMPFTDKTLNEVAEVVVTPAYNPQNVDSVYKETIDFSDLDGKNPAPAFDDSVAVYSEELTFEEPIDEIARRAEAAAKLNETPVYSEEIQFDDAPEMEASGTGLFSRSKKPENGSEGDNVGKNAEPRKSFGELLGEPYKVLAEIGSGEGTAYKALHTGLNKQVVLKRVHSQIENLANVGELVNKLKAINNPSLPKVIDYVQVNGTIYSVMEFIEGESLYKIVKDGRKIKRSQMAKWADQLAEAIKYLHSLKPQIIHADIKPSNIIISSSGRAVLADFNIAANVDENGVHVIGYSDGYAPPEQYEFRSANVYSNTNHFDDKFKKTVKVSPDGISTFQEGTTYEASSRAFAVVDERSDIYNFGATFYYALTGKAPESSTKEVTPVKKTGAKVDGEFAAVITKCMEKEPGKRYQTAEELAKAVKRMKRKSKTILLILAIILLLAIIVIEIFGMDNILGLFKKKPSRKTHTTDTVQTTPAPDDGGDGQEPDDNSVVDVDDKNNSNVDDQVIDGTDGQNTDDRDSDGKTDDGKKNGGKKNKKDKNKKNNNDKEGSETGDGKDATVTDAPTDTHEVSDTPVPTVTPEVTATPSASPTPTATPAPTPTEEPEVTEEPTPTEKPKKTTPTPIPTYTGNFDPTNYKKDVISFEMSDGSRKTYSLSKTEVFDVKASDVKYVYFGGFPNTKTIEASTLQNLSIMKEFENKDVAKYVDYTYLKTEYKLGGTVQSYYFYKFHYIRWKVIKSSKNELTLISNDILAFRPYDDSSEGSTWNNSDLNNWLTNDFKSMAFSSREKKLLNSAVSICSQKDAENAKLFADAAARKSVTTSYAKFTVNNGVTAADNYVAPMWWVKPNDSGSYSAVPYVDASGNVMGVNKSAVTSLKGVRPVVVIKIK